MGPLIGPGRVIGPAGLIRGKQLCDPLLQPLNPRHRLREPAVDLHQLRVQLLDSVLGEAVALFEPHQPIFDRAGHAYCFEYVGWLR